MKQRVKYVSAAAIFASVIVISVLFPTVIFRVQDRNILNDVHLVNAKEGQRGYHHTYSVKEKISMIRRSRQLGSEVMEQALYRHLSADQAKQIEQTCKEQITQLQEKKILPSFSFTFENALSEAVLLSYIDMQSPSKNVYLWSVILEQDNANIQVTVDMDTQKLMNVSVWLENPIPMEDDMQSTEIAAAWGDYLQIPDTCKVKEGERQAIFLYGTGADSVEYRYRIGEPKRWMSLIISDTKYVVKEAGTDASASIR